MLRSGLAHHDRFFLRKISATTRIRQNAKKHWPELTQAFGGLGATVLNTGELDAGLKQMIAFAVSNAAGCRYCQAHTANSAQKNNVSAEKIKAVFVQLLLRIWEQVVIMFL